MNFLKNNYYLNWVYSFFRGTSKLESFLSTPYNSALTQLLKEGYDFFEEFDDIIDIYSSDNSLSYEESKYIRKITIFYLKGNAMIIQLKISHSNIPIRLKLVKYAMSNLKLSMKNDDLKFSKKFAETETNNLKNILNKMLPIYEAVTIRRCIKIILEQLILKNIENIKVSHYIPSKKIILNYINSLKDISWRDDEIKKKNNEKIKILNLVLANHKENDEKLSPKIESNNNTINQILFILGNMKKGANNIVLFNEPDYIIFDFDENFFCPRNENLRNGHIIINNVGKKENSINNENKIPSSLVIKYLIYGPMANDINNKLDEEIKEFTKKKEIIEQILSNIHEKPITLDNTIEDINSIIDDIHENLSVLSLSNVKFKFNPSKLKNVIKYMENNKTNVELIPINSLQFTPEEKEFSKNINEILFALNIYERLKLNFTFKMNLELINYLNEAKILLDNLNILKEVKEKKEKLIENLSEQIKNVDKQIDEIKQKIKNIQEIGNLKRESLLKYESFLIKELGNVSIDFSKEINNFYFFTYLLQNGLYDETSYKSANGLYEEEI